VSFCRSSVCLLNIHLRIGAGHYGSCEACFDISLLDRRLRSNENWR
jgi:hypothetical protein